MFLALCLKGIAQTYYYSNKEESIIYTTSTGESSTKTINRETGSFRFVFETSNLDGRSFQLFTIYENGQTYNPGWYGELEKKGNIEFDNKIFSKTLYSYTGDRSKAFVLIALDYSRVVIFSADGRLYDYRR